VTFALHPSFVPPTRTVSEPPYEVTETGWGEFEIGIKARSQLLAQRLFSLLQQVEFVPDAESPPVELLHALKLYHGEAMASLAAEVPGSQPSAPVIRERYDEFVFVEPPAAFHAMLTSRPARPPPGDAEELFRVATARSAVAQQIQSMRAALSLDAGRQLCAPGG
jgi:YEATS domain-containing protein 4